MIAQTNAAVLPQVESMEDEDLFPDLAIPEITPADRAEWDTYLDTILERLSAVEGEIAENSEVAHRRILMIQGWERSVNEKLEREVAWLRQRFEAFARGYDFGKKKSRELPHGTFGKRKKPATLEIVDKDAALQFAKAAGLEIKVVESVNKTPLKAYLEATGEVPSGCEYVPESETFYVKPAGGGS